jgi:hypothetical protein
MAAENRGGATRAGWFNFSPAALSWPLAGCLALVVSASLYFQQQQPDAAITPTEQGSTVSASPTPQNSVSETTSQTGRSQSVEAPQSMDSTPLKNSLAVKASLASPRRVAPVVRGGGRTIVEAVQIREQVEESNSTSLMGSRVIVAGNSVAKGESALIPVQVSTQERPLKVFVRDTGGEARTISVESVSFGSRDVIGRPATISKASLSTNQGVW